LNYSYKFSFEYTNNEAEYEAFMLAIQILKNFQVKRVVIHGDSDLVIKQLQGYYQVRHTRMRSYKNVVLDLIECFEECEFSLIPRWKNGLADSLATSAMVFKIPIHPNRRYEIKFKNIPYVPENFKSWQVFEDEQQIQNILHLTGEFEGLIIEGSDSPLNMAYHSKRVARD